VLHTLASSYSSPHCATYTGQFIFFSTLCYMHWPVHILLHTVLHTLASSYSSFLYNPKWKKIGDDEPRLAPAGHAKARPMHLFHLCFVLPNLKFIKTWLGNKREQKVQGW